MRDRVPKILIVDDEPNMLNSLEIILREEKGYEVVTASSGEEAIKKADMSIDLALVDLSMPGKDGIEVLKELKKINKDMQVVIMTAYSTVRSAVQSIKSGAFEYLMKPFKMEEFFEVIDRALEVRRKVFNESTAIEKKGTEIMPFIIIGRSEKIKKVLHLINLASETDSTVLITGESGTGKELAARAIHTHSRRRDKPFVSVNCAAFPPALLESEFFGYKRGAFTGAVESRQGKFKLADGGTIFLDEIGEMSAEMQAKMLRVIETKEITPIGGERGEKVDVRIISATNKEVEEEVKKGNFREDLYFRVNIIRIHIPPLRERKEDIPLLVEYFLEKKSRELKMEKKSVSPSALKALMDYHFPGNVRELENIIENAFLLSDSKVIEKEHLRFTGLGRESTFEFPFGDLENAYPILKQKFRLAEERLIREAVLRYPHLSNEELARILGMTRRVLELRMKEYGISKKGEK